ncbi:MAG: hypothetical protein ACI4NE_03545 [Succinivibrio sp.]
MKQILVSFCTLLSLASFAGDDGFSEFYKDNSVTFEKEDGTARASLSVVQPVLSLSTTKDYAQYTMDSYQGWDLKAVLDLRGFSFKYVDNAPCSGLLTYFDGRSYLLFKACGDFKKDELSELYKRAEKRLHLKETLKKQSKPTSY